MTKLLLQLFVKDHHNTDAPKVRAAVGVLSGIVGIVCNILLFAGKLIIGTVSGSIAITADAMNNLTDASSSIVTLLGFKLAERPADAEHPYGHARFEYLSGLAVSAMILLIGYELGRSSLDKILNPQAVSFSLPVLIVLLLSIGVKLWLSLFNGKLGKLISSQTLQATATDSRNDVISTAAVLAASIIEFFTSWQVDGFVGLGVAAFILISGINLARETISPLLGEAASPELCRLIAQTISQEPKVLGYHDLMVHDYGPGQCFGSLHVEMDQAEDPMLCHDIIDNLERICMQEHNIHLSIHYDPIITGDTDLEAMRNTVVQILHTFDSQLSIHDFRMVKGVKHTNLLFDIVLPAHLLRQEKQVKEFLDLELDKLGDTKYYTVINFDHSAFNQ